MGFKDLRLFNQALLARQDWRLVAFPASLCARVLKAKYYPQGNLLDTVPASDASQTWRAIEYCLELLKQEIVMRIGDGRSTRIWRDNWLPRLHGMKPVGSTRTCRLGWVCHLIDPNTNSWDGTIMRMFFFPCDVAKILKIKLPADSCSDVAWNCEKTGLFTVRSAYRLAMRVHNGVGEAQSSVLPLQGMDDMFGKVYGKFNYPLKLRSLPGKLSIMVCRGALTNAIVI